MSEYPKFQRPLCAVVDCIATPKPHVCPADGERHSHGCIHYRYCETDLTFREGWHQICDTHYEVCVKARLDWERDAAAAAGRS